MNDFTEAHARELMRLRRSSVLTPVEFARLVQLIKLQNAAQS